jgi:hypothetical protein
MYLDALGLGIMIDGKPQIFIALILYMEWFLVTIFILEWTKRLLKNKKNMNKGFNIKNDICSSSLLQPYESHASRGCICIFSQEKE